MAVIKVVQAEFQVLEKITSAICFLAKDVLTYIVILIKHDDFMIDFFSYNT